MALSREQLLAEALALEPMDREALADDILRSLSDAEQHAIDAAWLEEARRRDRGPVKGSTVDEVIERVRAQGRR